MGTPNGSVALKRSERYGSSSRRPAKRSHAHFEVFDIPIGVMLMEEAVAKVADWAMGETSFARMVAFTNVHMLAESRGNPELKEALLHSDLNFPDGRPVSWIARCLFGQRASQIAGPDFMPLFCETTSAENIRHFFYGGAPGVAAAAAAELQRRNPTLTVAGSICPPFRPLTVEEETQICSDINATQPDVIWVCLGCPKQELWISRHRTQLNAKVVLAVGQAMDILAGVRRRAPQWMHSFGLEWLYRLVEEPGRLWKRYLVTNTVFIFWVVTDLIRGKFRALEH